jgi:glycosyltransferase involved in cell wall biosynthesis
VLTEQFTRSGSFEVVVVDDGSTDGTQAVVEHARTRLPSLAYRFRARDATSSRAKARNLGAEASTGESILFLDAGVLPGPALIQHLRQAIASGPHSVVICRTLGLFAPEPAEDHHGDIERLFERLPQLEADPDWADMRDPYLSAIRTSPARVPAIWLLAWTSALMMPRRAFLDAGRFDEAFLGWGCEDIELAARLAQRRCEFRWLESAVAVHLPHSRSARHANDHLENARRMHRKLLTRESELYLFWLNAFAVNLIAARLDLLDLLIVAEPTALPATSMHWQRQTVQRKKILCAGLVWSGLLAKLEPDVVLVHERSAIPRLRQWCPNARIECLVGLFVPFKDDSFDVAVVGDFVRLLPQRMRHQHLLEMGRVARQVSLVLSRNDGHEAHYRELAGWTWASVPELMEDSRQLGFALEAVETTRADAVELVLRRGIAP